jgi:hypothetical protein
MRCRNNCFKTVRHELTDDFRLRLRQEWIGDLNVNLQSDIDQPLKIRHYVRVSGFRGEGPLAASRKRTIDGHDSVLPDDDLWKISRGRYEGGGSEEQQGSGTLRRIGGR